MTKSIIATLLIVICSCKKKTNCNNIPTEFSSYEEAITTIRERTFRLKDSIDIPEGKIIKYAWYYSCDGTKGYLFRRHSGGAEYFVSNVPINIWQELKKNDSKEMYFDSNISGKYSSVTLIREIQ